ncbi:hypothetical protein ULMS_21340 [Patiriisocius marinistellae]|uniref:Uncharacterized protein n=1 Tax=Patiriisocius marinistellae TaxID=2494560 RepID=A0A5J4G1Y0_9FLAO|nr:hypothetical protein ULMS_21340 [Patiriisocius marinistellae]
MLNVFFMHFGNFKASRMCFWFKFLMFLKDFGNLKKQKNPLSKYLMASIYLFGYISEEKQSNL